MHDDQLALAGIRKSWDYTQYSHDKNVNVIPEEDFKRLIHDTFSTIAEVMRKTYGPYGSNVMLCTESNETFTTKDGYNVFGRIGFSQPFQRLVYMAIQNIIDRVNENVGDGTTSCILLADKMFTALENVVKTKDAKREIIPILNEIEEMLTDRKHVLRDIDSGLIKPLTMEALRGLIHLASNYDSQLTDKLMEALQPVVDPQTNAITSVRNVVVDSKVQFNGSVSNRDKYTIDFLPGDYRIHVEMQQECALLFENGRKIRVAIYDHGFNSSDWNFFMENFDRKTETLIITPRVNASVLDNEYLRYCKDLALAHADLKIMFANIKGGIYIRDEIKDLCAALNTTSIASHAIAVDHESLPVLNVQVCRGNVMCFDMPEIPTAYIENLKKEMEADTSDSLSRAYIYKERIRALSNTAKDTIISVKTMNSLEQKMLGDKIDDCLHIVNSAIEFGIVPNLFIYGVHRINEAQSACEPDSLKYDVLGAISKSLQGLFADIWHSKHDEYQEPKMEAIQKELYGTDNSTMSFDVVREAYISLEQMPTSSQYDLEVIAATIEIVKYLLDSRACVFGIQLFQSPGDTGHYSAL